VIAAIITDNAAAKPSQEGILGRKVPTDEEVLHVVPSIRECDFGNGFSKTSAKNSKS